MKCLLLFNFSESASTKEDNLFSHFLLNVTQTIHQINQSKSISRFCKPQKLKLLCLFYKLMLKIDKIIPQFTTLTNEIWTLVLTLTFSFVQNRESYFESFLNIYYRQEISKISQNQIAKVNEQLFEKLLANIFTSKSYYNFLFLALLVCPKKMKLFYSIKKKKKINFKKTLKTKSKLIKNVHQNPEICLGFIDRILKKINFNMFRVSIVEIYEIPMIQVGRKSR